MAHRRERGEAGAGQTRFKDIALCLLLDKRATGDGRAPAEGTPGGLASAGRLLLGEKLRGFGRGKLVLPGGHLDPGETGAACAARELEEETSISISPTALVHVGTLFFEFPAEPHLNMKTGVFRAVAEAGERPPWRGEARGSEELAPRWFELGQLPTERMWQDAQHWVTRLASAAPSSQPYTARIVMAADNERVARVELAPRTRSTGG